MSEADWKSRCGGKIVTAEQAVQAIQPGRRILIGSGAAEPVSLVQALVDYGGHLADNEIVHLLTLGPAPYVREDRGSASGTPRSSSGRTSATRSSTAGRTTCRCSCRRFPS